MDAVEALIQGLVLFQGGVLMVLHSFLHFSRNNILKLCTFIVCKMSWLHLHVYSLAGKSRWTPDIWKRWSAVGCIRRQGDTLWWDLPGLQKNAPVLEDYLLVQSSCAVWQTHGFFSIVIWQEQTQWNCCSRKILFYS